jgi:hypothetical protein
VYHWTSARIAAVLALVTLCWAILAWPWLSGSVTIPYDAKAHFQAQLQFLATALHNGQSPFWSPNVFAGTPQIADPQSLIFSPFLLLAALTPAPSFRALDIYVLVLLLMGAGAITMIFRDRNWHPAGAVVAALAYAFGASAAWRIQHIGQIESFAFFAVALWALLRAIQRRSLVWSALTGLGAALMFVEPDQIAFLGLLLLGGIAMGEVLSMPGGTRPWRRIAAMATLAGVIFLALVAVPLTWIILFAEASNRPEVSYAEAARASLHPAALLTAIFGDMFGAANPAIAFWGPSSQSWDPSNLSLSQNMIQLYAGALPALAVIVFGTSRKLIFARDIRVVTGALAFALVYALGSATPVFHVLFDLLPGVSAFRRPADATFMIGGLGAIVAGYVVHRFAGGTVARGTASRLGLEVLAIALLLGVAAAIAVNSGKLDLAARPLALALLWLAASGAALAVLSRHGQTRPLAAAALAATLMVADLSANNGPNNSTALPPQAYDLLDPACKNDTIALIKRLTRSSKDSVRRDRVELAGIGFDWPNLGLIHGFDHTLGYNPLRLADFNEATGARDGIAGIDEKKFTALYPSYRSTFANLLGLRYIAVPVPLEQVDKTLAPGALPLIARTKDAYVYENTQALPRAMFVSGWRTVDFETVLEEGFPADFDPQKTVLIENQIEEGEGPSATAESNVSRVAMSQYSNTEIVIEVEAERAGFVVLNDVWHPWWSATVDGEEAEILKANVVFRAVQVPAGKHKVRFSFKPLDGAIAELMTKISPEK